MVFSSVTFLFFFLPLFLLAYFLLPQKNAILLAASLLFYAWGEAEYTAVLLVSIAMNYGFGLWIAAARAKGDARLALGIGVAANLALLGYYKYFNFLAGVTADALGLAGLAPPAVAAVHLPLGISFFTFHALSYLIDVKRGQAPPVTSPFSLALYITMFPQLVAGPIIRFSTIADKLDRRRHSVENFSRGIDLFFIGFAHKVLIANTLAVPADAIFGLAPERLTTPAAWLGAVCYTLQIYFDFAGYSIMAMGLGLMLGFTFPRNFDYPYISQSITEFWRRWHISLSSWFRDYLYIPLGGNRGPKWRTYANLFAVFLLCGLWHGAAWTFLLWGVYHGLFLVLERIGLGQALDGAWRPLRHLYAMVAVIFGWVLFRADSLAEAGTYLAAMLGFAKGSAAEAPVLQHLSHSVILALIVGVIAATGLLSRPLLAEAATGVQARLLRYCLRPGLLWGSFVLACLSIASGSYNPFIYFRF